MFYYFPQFGHLEPSSPFPAQFWHCPDIVSTQYDNDVKMMKVAKVED